MGREIELSITLKLGGRWSGDTGLEEVKDHVRNRINTALGFRARVTRLRVVGCSEIRGSGRCIRNGKTYQG